MMNRSLYGRKWEMRILCNDGEELILGQDGFTGLESLKVSFEINYPGYEGWYISEFSLWNPTKETEKKIIKEGAQVFFYAGYKDGNYGQIFGGSVFQALYVREDVTDYKLTLLCIDGERLFRDNISSFTLNKDYTDQTLLNAIAARARTPIKVGKISSQVDNTPKPRGVTYWAPPSVGIREVSRGNRAQFFVVNDQLNIMKPTDTPQGDEIVINPASGLIGTPEQIDYGVNFRVLLNPSLILANPPRWVKLDMSEINIKQQRAVPGQTIVPILPKDGYFKIGGVRHRGDTRGNDWYTDVVGYSLTGKAGLQLTVPEMLKDPSGNPNS